MNGWIFQQTPTWSFALSICISFSGGWATLETVKFRRAPVRYLCSLLLILAGASGILFSPSVGLFGGTELRSFTINEPQEYSWGRVIASSEVEVPFIKNQRGLFYMNLFLAGSLGAFFSGVHWFAALRNKPCHALG